MLQVAASCQLMSAVKSQQSCKAALGTCDWWGDILVWNPCNSSTCFPDMGSLTTLTPFCWWSQMHADRLSRMPSQVCHFYHIIIIADGAWQLVRGGQCCQGITAAKASLLPTNKAIASLQKLTCMTCNVKSHDMLNICMLCQFLTAWGWPGQRLKSIACRQAVDIAFSSVPSLAYHESLHRRQCLSACSHWSSQKLPCKICNVNFYDMLKVRMLCQTLTTCDWQSFGFMAVIALSNRIDCSKIFFPFFACTQRFLPLCKLWASTLCSSSNLSGTTCELYVSISRPVVLFPILRHVSDIYASGLPKFLLDCRECSSADSMPLCCRKRWWQENGSGSKRHVHGQSGFRSRGFYLQALHGCHGCRKLSATCPKVRLHMLSCLPFGLVMKHSLKVSKDSRCTNCRLAHKDSASSWHGES